MKYRKSGFTLMEIMVVIIVIAVLASVSGPMVGSITNQGRISATKSRLSALKNALLAYQSDVGRLPHIGKGKCSGCISAYNGELLLSYNDENANVLLTDSHTPNFSIKKYSRKWKGPYMDSDPSDFMYDAWGHPIHYIADGRNLFLWSYGEDDEPANANATKAFAMQQNEDEYCDDIILSIKKFRRKLN